MFYKEVDETMKTIINFICASFIAIIGIYFTISICMILFILSGQLQVGEGFIDGDIVPSVPTILLFQVASLLAMAVLVLIRAKFGKKYDFKFLEPK